MGPDLRVFRTKKIANTARHIIRPIQSVEVVGLHIAGRLTSYMYYCLLLLCVLSIFIIFIFHYVTVCA